LKKHYKKVNIYSMEHDDCYSVHKDWLELKRKTVDH